MLCLIYHGPTNRESNSRIRMSFHHHRFWFLLLLLWHMDQLREGDSDKLQKDTLVKMICWSDLWNSLNNISVWGCEKPEDYLQAQCPSVLRREDGGCEWVHRVKSINPLRGPPLSVNFFAIFPLTLFLIFLEQFLPFRPNRRIPKLGFLYPSLKLTWGVTILIKVFVTKLKKVNTGGWKATALTIPLFNQKRCGQGWVK